MDEEEKSTPPTVEPATTDSAASSPPSPPAGPVAPAASSPAAEPRRGPGRPKGSGKKGKKGKKARPAKPAKPSKVERDDEDDDEGDEDDEAPRAELARVEPSTPVERDPSLPETPEEREQRYSEMKARIVRHAPTWERRAESLGLASLIDLGLVAASGEKGFAEPDAFAIAIPTSGGARQIKCSGGSAVVRALAQFVAAYSPETASDVIAHPLADATAALASVAASLVMARIAPLLRELMKGDNAHGTADTDTAETRAVAA